ncbi:myristylated membrane protein [Fowlpox virus]|uniref:Entry-fusion complex associated protein OPG095 n=2 Tax=Fowlpox virus TaxID=10261 RepID=PG095_FOWPN|nr:Myristylated membrane protein [Fowlpox virus]P15910.4 RecName: Full=Entry-fusion complex associated protein OPG095; AltName: Full=EFC-associated protein OPG095; AltName: Full=Protein L1; AltName: Full=Protein L1 homolog; AltName: Full=Virion membrane protein M25 [Fowlpox virus strain NVSL]UNS14344.1 ALPV-180 [Albatrosspox virus]WPD90835.1 L1-like myristylated membrane protein [Avipoxvirus sp.]CAE52667.1 L1R orthologue [Fowlpox virus isolate HP-438/Munich]AAF44472.1 ORF FPV128 Myristylated m
MGAAASIQTTVTTINKKISEKLEQTASASATANCDINIGNIIFKKNKGCNVLVKNMCSANASAQLDAIVSAVREVYDQLTEQQKAYAPSLLTAALNIQTNVSTITQDFETYIKQKCNSDAVINNIINVQSLEVDECSAPPGQIMTFEFINTGTATGNCAMKSVLDVLTKSSDRVSGNQSTGNDFSKYLYIIGGIICFLILLYYAKKLFFMSTNDKVKVLLAKKPDVHWTTYIDTYFRSSPVLV